MSFVRNRRYSAWQGLTGLLAIIFTLAFAATTQAQILSNPRIAEFDPSPDHWTVLDNGQPAVVRYELGVYLVGASAPLATVDMGKPAPDADGKIRYDFSTLVAGWPLPGGNYEALVGAVGPEGWALSDPSNPFTFTTTSTCAVTLNTTTVSAWASGGNYVVDVVTGTGCEWTATTALTWVTLGTKSGSGNGTVTFAVQANSSSSSRTGAIYIGGQTLTLRQDGVGTPVISWPPPASIVEGTPLSSAQLNATANVPGSFVYSPTAGTVLAKGQYTLKASFTPSDPTVSSTATAYVNLTVTPATSQFIKVSPANGAVGLESTVTLQWSAVADSGYWVCWDTTNNNTCDASWWPNGGGAGRVLTGLPNGTYYWQVRAQNASGTFDADGGTWRSFTVGGAPQLPAAFGKVSPTNGATGLGSGVTLAWGTSTGATGYEVCADTTNDGACGATWQSAGTAAAFGLSGLAAGTYYWQVRATNASGTAYADGGTWRSFTVSATPALFGKLTPANGAVGLESTVTLQWSAVADSGYWVCWDTTNNNTCDASWWPNGGGAGRVLTGLPNGTYYWQVRAQNASGTFDADGGTWRSFTVGGPPQPPAAFGKVMPANGATGLGSAVTLAWGTSTGATGYEVCVDTTNDGACGAAWQSAGTTASFGLSGLAAGTYYWQVRATNSSGTAYADGGTWRSFTVSATPALFGKLTPANGAVGLGSTVMLQWSVVADAGYWVCWDTTNNNTCDSAWWPNGGGAGRVLTGLAPGTYYWQIRAQRLSGTVDADNGTWWSFTVR